MPARWPAASVHRVEVEVGEHGVDLVQPGPVGEVARVGGARTFSVTRR